MKNENSSSSPSPSTAVFSRTLILANPELAQRFFVHDSQMATYRVLAQLIFQSFIKNELDTAATLGRILERTWDRNEKTGEGGLNQTVPMLFRNIDEAMAAFIKPLIDSDHKKPAPHAVEAAYKEYLHQLKAAE